MLSIRKCLIGLASILFLVALLIPLQASAASDKEPVNVNVTNTAAQAVPVREVGVTVRTPVVIKVNTLIYFGVRYGTETVYTVPAGKRLVIQHVAFESDNLWPGNSIKADVVTAVPGEAFVYPLDAHAQTMSAGDPPRYVMNHPLLAFADAGAHVVVEAVVSNPQGNMEGDFFSAVRGTLSGYLETVP